jgi:hypothetical protein
LSLVRLSVILPIPFGIVNQRFTALGANLRRSGNVILAEVAEKIHDKNPVNRKKEKNAGILNSLNRQAILATWARFAG